MKHPRVLIVSASVGNGHMSATRAIHEECERRGVPVKSIDMIEFTPRAFQGWYRGGYERAVKDTPKLWGFLYALSDVRGPIFSLQDWLDRTFCFRLDPIVREFDPDVVVCTHSLPQPRLLRLKRQGLRFRMTIVVTDMHPHKMWLRGEPDDFAVPSDWSIARLKERMPELTDDRVAATGIPIHRGFVAIGEFADQDPPLVVLTSGGIGGGPIVEAMEALSSVPERCRIVAVAGRNERARQDLERHAAALPAGRNPVEVRGHVPLDQMAELVRGCTLMVAKSGGLTSSEALAAGAPFVVYLPLLIPGQEEQNAEFLKESGAGVHAANRDELVATVMRLLRSPEERRAMRSKALLVAKPNAAARIVDGLLEHHTGNPPTNPISNQ
ncbi:MAG: glycosyltransferase [Fimbriimonadaceae bacterium]|nr:glycosyltransferase [Fimbriimonadaceae bacterium]